MFDEFSSDDEDYDPYIFKKCKQGYNINGGGFCCRSCQIDKSDQQYIRNSREFLKKILKEAEKEIMGPNDNYNYNDNNKRLIKILNINYNNFINLNNKEKIKLINKQYKKQSLKCHPDKIGGSTNEFIRLKEASEILISYYMV